MFAEEFRTTLLHCLQDPALSPLSHLVDPAALARLERFVLGLRRANERVNLTAISDAAGMAVKHVADSLLALSVGHWPVGARVADVGTGGGLPGVVLAAVRPDLRIVLIDAVAKKLAALEGILLELELGVETVHGRAEDVGRSPAHRERYDVVTARAVARLPVLLELCLPLLRVGGWFVALKGPEARPEIDEARAALAVLGGTLAEVREVNLPFDAGARTLIAIEKSGPTPAAYPRRAGIPAKNPITGA